LAAVNTFGFIGVLLDVISAFLSLLSSALIRFNMELADGALGYIKALTPGELLEVRQLISGPSGSRPFRGNLLGKYLAFEMLDGMKELSSESSNSIDVLERVTSAAHNRNYAITVIEELDRPTRFITHFRFISQAAVTATMCGIFSFLISIVCLAIATQPDAVWICAIAVSSAIVLLPASWLFVFKIGALEGFDED
jgi:hypothetical protein